MGKKTGIKWTQKTHNFWYGCKKVSQGCRFCYAEREMKRFGRDFGIITKAKGFDKPLKWKESSLVFVNSWSDWFIEEADPWRGEAWEIIRATPHLTYQILTKRPERIPDCLPRDFFPKNVWWGISAEDQKTLDLRWSILDLALYGYNSPIKFISAEPLLGPLDLTEYMTEYDLDLKHKTVIPDWIIVGGESGAGHREMNISWLKDIYWQCRLNHIPLFVKQDSGNMPSQQRRIPDEFWIQEFPEKQKQEIEK